MEGGSRMDKLIEGERRGIGVEGREEGKERGQIVSSYLVHHSPSEWRLL